jgi:glycogen debranching enzyme
MGSGEAPPPPPQAPTGVLVRLRPRPGTLYVAQGRTVLATNRDGSICGEPDHGLFFHETRLVSRHRLTVDGEPLHAVALSNVLQHSFLGYFIRVPPGFPEEERDRGSGQTQEASQQALELRISRYVGSGLHEDVDLANFTRRPTSFRLRLELEADFADRVETLGDRVQQGRLTRDWDAGAAELRFDYRVERVYDHQGGRGTAALHRGVVVRVARSGSPPALEDGGLSFAVDLRPQDSWHACLDFAPVLDGRRIDPTYSCRSFMGVDAEHDRRRRIYLDESTRFEVPQAQTLAAVVVGALEQARTDLMSLRLDDLDTDERSWTVAAGLPVFVALFGRDTLIAGWQSALASTAIMRGTLPVLAHLQGRRVDDWRDEQPGKMLHEAHTGPLASLNINPWARYYGSITTSGFYPVVLSELWHWTGEEAAVRPFVEAALGGLRWLDEYALQPDGFYYYLSRSPLGTKHQGWKDSGDAIVYEDGSPVEPPIAVCEEQAFVHVAKLHLSEVLWWLGEKDLAKRLHHEASELKKRFADAFWMEGEGFPAMARDAQGRPVRSVGSNGGHCVAAGILDESLVPRAVQRLFASDLFSGWGIRTLSDRHPAYNPYSYHRGSIWPVEHGSFAMGFLRYGLHGELHRLARAQFEAARLFDFYRLPEVFAGHPRDEDHPFPAFYREACSPQAWSASAIFCLVQSMLGVYPYAPLKMLLVDPHPPEWLPEITLRNLKVGQASADIRFFRKDDGRGDYEVLDVRGTLHVVRQPSPWSLTASFGERLRDALTSLLPGK